MTDTGLVAVFGLITLLALVIIVQSTAAGVQRTRQRLRVTRERRTYGRPASS